MTRHDTIVILDFGSQYSQLIARRVREQYVFCRLEPCTLPLAELRALAPKGVILSGGPASVYDEGAPGYAAELLELGVPVLGICYGMQLLARMMGGTVERGGSGEYGPATVEIVERDAFFEGCGDREPVWMSHGDRVTALPEGARVTARTPTVATAAFADPQRRLYGVQFHPEVYHTPRGETMLRNFLLEVCGCAADWKMSAFIDEATAAIREQVGTDRVVCGLSGGIDSTVVATVVHRAVGDRLTSIFVDNGVLREREAEEVLAAAEAVGLNVEFVDAAARFLERLGGVTDPEEKRRAIGDEFARVFTEEAERGGGARFLAQGTLFPDVIESRSAHGGPSATIKTHHNVGGMPSWSRFELIEPLRFLFKDEVRELGRELDLPHSILHRQPFPGPGLAVRVVGEVTPERLAILRHADRIVQEEMRDWEGYGGIWQSFAVLLPVRSVGVMGDARTYGHPIVLRVVTSRDGMTADWARLPDDLLARTSARIINEVAEVNRVLYDISSKPPSTIEWE
ncbi:MAG: glutamine-hydrolyzing GMP synthase [Planctomycetota bacterium]